MSLFDKMSENFKKEIAARERMLKHHLYFEGKHVNEQSRRSSIDALEKVNQAPSRKSFANQDNSSQTPQANDFA